MLRFIREPENALVLTEVHKEVCSSHNGGRALAHKLLRVGYYWPTLMKDNMALVKKYDQ